MIHWQGIGWRNTGMHAWPEIPLCFWPRSDAARVSINFFVMRGPEVVRVFGSYANVRNGAATKSPLRNQGSHHMPLGIVSTQGQHHVALKMNVVLWCLTGILHRRALPHSFNDRTLSEAFGDGV